VRRRPRALSQPCQRRVGQRIREAPVCLLQFSRDGKRLFTAGRDAGGTTFDGDPGAGSGLVWDLTREPPAPLGPPIRFNEKWALLAALAPDGDRVIACGAENVARLYDVATGQPLPPTFAHEARVWRVDFSPDGARVLTSGQDGTARLWDAATGAEIARYQHGASVFQAFFSRDGTRILTGAADRTLRVWDTATRQPAGPPVRMEVMLHQSHFTGDSDGDRFVTVTGTQLMRVWDTATGQPLSEPIRSPVPIHVARIGPDGQMLLVVPWTDRVYLYDTGPTPGPAPTWFADFAEATLGARLDVAGQLTSITNSFAFPQTTDDAGPYARLARQLTSSRAAP
jgi:WD40 repeat protein